MTDSQNEKYEYVVDDVWVLEILCRLDILL